MHRNVFGNAQDNPRLQQLIRQRREQTARNLSRVRVRDITYEELLDEARQDVLQALRKR